MYRVTVKDQTHLLQAFRVGDWVSLRFADDKQEREWFDVAQAELGEFRDNPQRRQDPECKAASELQQLGSHYSGRTQASPESEGRIRAGRRAITRVHLENKGLPDRAASS
jgi:hypothetical protein